MLRPTLHTTETPGMLFDFMKQPGEWDGIWLRDLVLGRKG